MNKKLSEQLEIHYTNVPGRRHVSAINFVRDRPHTVQPLLFVCFNRVEGWEGSPCH